MRKILFATVAVLGLAAASSSFAAGNAATQINASLLQACVIDAQTPSVDISTGVANPTFTYQCNFTGSPTLSFTSANGGVVKPAGADAAITAPYGIYLNTAAPSGTPSSWLQSTVANGGPGSSYGPAGGNPAITATTAPNTQTTPYFSVGLDTPLSVAGTYTDTLTVSITP
jgi:hypothetical protein